MDCNFISTPCRLNKKLDLIRRTSPTQSPKEYNYICNTLDTSINQLETKFRYLRQASSPAKTFNDNLSHSYSVNYSMISPRTHFQKKNTSVMYSPSSMKKNINNTTYLVNYAQKSELLQRQLEEKNGVINEYENMFIITLDKIKKLREENARMKMELGMNVPTKYTSNINMNEEDVQYIKRQCKKIKKEQDKCDRNVDELYCLSTSMNNENYKMNRRDERNRWEEMRKMNEELQIASKENKNKELTSQIKVNQLKLQIQKLQDELSSYNNKQYEY